MFASDVLKSNTIDDSICVSNLMSCCVDLVVFRSNTVAVLGCYVGNKSISITVLAITRGWHVVFAEVELHIECTTFLISNLILVIKLMVNNTRKVEEARFCYVLAWGH